MSLSLLVLFFQFFFLALQRIAPFHLSEPAIIRAGNAENRRTKQLQATSTAPRLPDSTKMSDETTPTHETSGSTRTADAADMQTAKDWFKSVFKIQHAAIIEAQADRRQAAEDR
ncbi:hypothetical protein PGTUg99_031871 [Puccinia graminis f. sp. tritici]|uniref:Secreted protein n=1 Tax=Puccinia graminis f. sp. tritici TaxID=56615 RepID=A0A5B0MIK9_PUCGR|nr:hypothetical protein PGTUg99_031871 [Puccinia graminis f. sp. tritici]